MSKESAIRPYNLDTGVFINLDMNNGNYFFETLKLCHSVCGSFYIDEPPREIIGFFSNTIVVMKHLLRNEKQTST